MKELLSKLQKADPACYEDIRRRVIIDVDEDFEIYAGDQTYRENVDDTIQGCICRAIAAKGYMFSISHIWPKESLPAYEWKARIFIDPDNIVEIRSNSPAESILRAYIGARP